MSNRQAVVSAIACGATYQSASEQFGVSVATAWRWAQADSPTTRRPRLTSDLRESIQRDIATASRSLREIARSHGCHHTTAQRLRSSIPLAWHRPHAVAAIAAGETYASFARRSRLTISTVWKWVQEDLEEPPTRSPRLPPELKRKIQTAIDSRQYSFRKIAVAHGVHTSTVCEIRDAMSIGGHRAKPIRCPNCRQLILTQECLICAAREYSQRSSGFV